MGNATDEISPHGFQSSHFRNVPNHGHSARMRTFQNWNSHQNQIQLLSRGSIFKRLHLATGKGLGDHFQKRGNSDRFVKTVSNPDRVADGKQVASAGIHEDDSLLHVDGDDTFNHGIHDCRQQFCR